MKRVAERIVAAKKNGDDVVVVVSAMGDTTDELLDLASQITDDPPGRELDMLLTAGERISMALLAIAISTHGYEARSFTGSQAGVITTSAATARPGSSTSRPAGCARRWTRARSSSSPASRASARTPRTSPRSAAAAPTPPPSPSPPRCGADVCEIYTDVDGVFTADPRIVPNARGSTPSPTRRCSSWPPRGPRCSCCAASSTPAARASPCTSAAPTHSSPARSCPARWRTSRWNRRSSRASRTTAAKARSPSTACPTGPARRPRSSACSPTPRSTST